MKPLDYILIWLLCFGVWPIFDPGHDADTIGSVLDIGIHFVALAWLLSRWRVLVVRRN